MPEVTNTKFVDEVNCAIASGLQVSFRRDDREGWCSIIAALGYIPVAFSPAWIDYQLAYHQGHESEWRDLSMVLLHDHRPCGVWPLSLATVAGQKLISSHGPAVLPPLFVPSLPDRSRKSVVKRCLDLLATLNVSADRDSATSAESFAADNVSGLSEWHVQSMRRGARATLRHEMYVDLTLSMEEIKARCRKSYRALISSGARTWRVAEMVSADPTRWSQFRELHASVAGRITRCAESWELQHQAIVNGDGLLVYLLDESDRMVGGGYFGITRDEGVYSVGAYDRSLFDKPLGHVVQYRAIELLKQRGARWYKIGARPFKAELPKPDDKELSIGEFKQGFATHFFPRYELDHEFKTIDSR